MLLALAGCAPWIPAQAALPATATATTTATATATALPTATATPPPPGVYPRLLMIGDSITAGTGAGNVHRAWPETLAHLLRARNPGSGAAWLAIGLAGDSTSQMLATLSALRLSAQADLVVVELGTNDWGQARPLTTFRADYAALLALVLAGNPTARLVCLTGWPHGVGGATARNALGLTMAAYDSVIRQVCAEVQPGSVTVDLTPVYAPWADHDSFDSYHPTDAGHAAIARAIAAALSGSS